MTEEIWKAIPGFSKYQASNLGRIKSFFGKTPKILKPSTTKDGYKMICPKDDNGKISLKGIHQLVALAFLGECPENMLVCHNDENSSNNYLDNLRYDTQGGNIQDYILSRRSIFNEDNMGEDTARLINMMVLAGNVNYQEIAYQFKLSHNTVIKIASGKLFPEIYEEIKRTFIV